MALHMREQLIRAVLAHAQGEIEKHKANVNVYLEHPTYRHSSQLLFAHQFSD